MTNEGLHNIAVYNPGLWSDAELEHYFIARRPLLKSILADLRREKIGTSPQHRIILGLRGMGKTTLLRRIALSVNEDNKLSKNWIPLNFPEEQYNIAKPVDLWLNCLDALGDAFDDMGQKEDAAKLDQKIEAIQDNDEAAALALLLNTAKDQKKRLLLLLDNIDLVLDRLKDEHWKIRETLQSETQLLFIGASSRALEVTYQYDAAFYDFFKVDELKKLSLKEMKEILTQLATLTKSPKVIDLLKNDPGRIRALYTLTGGNPRTTVLLFKVFANGFDGDVRSDLEGLLDMVTPLYKARFEDLPTLSQQVVDALALAWDPIGAKALSEKLGMDVSKVSAQLSRLEQNAIVEKTNSKKVKRATFQISERFFNIWYLMRASRRVRRKLFFLVHFLRMFFSPDELQTHARDQLKNGREDGTRSAEYSLALAQAVENVATRTALETHALNSIINGNKGRRTIEKMLDLGGDDAELVSKVDRIQQLLIISDEISPVLKKHNLDAKRFIFRLTGSPSMSLKEKRRFADTLLTSSPEELQEKERFLARGWGKWERLIGSNTNIIYEALSHGDMASIRDIEGARAADERYGEAIISQVSQISQISRSGLMSDLHADELKIIEKTCRQWIKINQHTEFAWICLGELYQNHLKQPIKAEKAFRKAIEADPECAEGWDNLGSLLSEDSSRLDEAERALVKAIELDPDNSSCHFQLGILFQYTSKKYNEAEEVYRRGLNIDPDFAGGWSIYGNLLRVHLNRFDDAEEAFRKAIELNNNEVMSWFGLGRLLGDDLQQFDEAEKAFRKAIEINPDDCHGWTGLGILLSDKLKRYNEAEEAFRKAIECHPEDPAHLENLGELLHYNLTRFEESEMVFRKAIKIDPGRVNSWIGLGNVLNEGLERYGDAEIAFRKAIEVDPDNPSAWGNLGELLRHTDNRLNEAEEAFRKIIDLNPNDYRGWFSLGNLFEDKLERYDEAAMAFRRVIEINPDNYRSWYRLGSLLEDKLERYDEAETAFRKVIEINPRSCSGWSGLGHLLANHSERYDETEEALRKSIECHPGDATHWRNLGSVLEHKLQRYDDAEDAYRKALEFDPENALSWRALGNLLDGVSKQFPEAEAAFRNAIKFDVEHSSGFNSLAWHLYNHGSDLTEAVSFGMRAVELDPEELNAVHTLAMLLVRTGAWQEAVPYIKQLISDGDTEFYDHAWSEILNMFKLCVEQGQVEDSLKLIDETNAKERWRPLREAIAAIASGSIHYLDGVAPEVREPAESIVEKLSPGFFEQ